MPFILTFKILSVVYLRIMSSKAEARPFVKFHFENGDSAVNVGAFFGKSRNFKAFIYKLAIKLFAV